MPKKISKKDMEALADLIREKGFKVIEFGDFLYTVYVNNPEKDMEVIIGHDAGHFVSNGKIPGFPMTSHGHGGIPYRFAI